MDRCHRYGPKGEKHPYTGPGEIKTMTEMLTERGAQPYPSLLK